MLMRPVYAELGGDFWVTGASWSASDIVVVETTTIDGIFEVIEPWKGNLTIGSRITLPELIPLAAAIPLSAYPTPSPAHDDLFQQLPKQPEGSQLILFLKRSKESAGSRDASKSKWSGWDGDDSLTSMKISAVWIDRGNLYAFQKQMMSTGPAVLSGLVDRSKPNSCCAPLTRRDLRSLVDEVLQIQINEEAAVAMTNGRERALRLKTFANSEIGFVQSLAFQELGKSGPAAVSTIEEMLDDPKYSQYDSELVEALVEAGGKPIGAQLNRRLEMDLTFWSSVGPSLPNNWWNVGLTPEAPLRNRYSQTFSLVNGLGQLEYRGALAAVRKLRSVWLALPPLALGDTQMVDACDQLLAKAGVKIEQP